MYLACLGSPFWQYQWSILGKPFNLTKISINSLKIKYRKQQPEGVATADFKPMQPFSRTPIDSDLGRLPVGEHKQSLTSNLCLIIDSENRPRSQSTITSACMQGYAQGSRMGSWPSAGFDQWPHILVTWMCQLLQNTLWIITRLTELGLAAVRTCPLGKGRVQRRCQVW